jgi:UDPglucose 6-dehydrogenase
MFNTVTGKKIAILGFASKKDTGNICKTPLVFVVCNLVHKQAKIHVYNSQVKCKDMWIEMDYTCKMNVTNHSGLDEAVMTSPDA